MSQPKLYTCDFTPFEEQIVQARIAAAVAAAIPPWQPLDTAPIEPFESLLSHFAYRFRCLLQFKSGYVCEGWAYYVVLRNKSVEQRWATSTGMCKADDGAGGLPLYWMPMPAPKVEA